MSDPAKAGGLEQSLPEQKPDTATPQGLRAFYIANGIDLDEMERQSALLRAPGPFTRPGGTGPDELHEDERADLRASGFYDRNRGPKS